MRFKIKVAMSLICLMGFNASAGDQTTICEGDGGGGHVSLEYHSVGPDQYEALAMNYGGRNVLGNPTAVVNHLDGTIVFTSPTEIEFVLKIGSNDFFVTVPAFGDHLKTTKGTCRLKGMEGKFRFEVSTLSGVPFIFSSAGAETAFIHLYDAGTGEQLSCNVDIDIQRFEVLDETGHSVFSVVPSCRTNLGGVLSAYFAVPKAGKFTLKAVSSDASFTDSDQDIIVR
jgi:hypothetical protein